MPNYRRIIDAYRTKLMEVSPSACNEVDDLMWANVKTRWVVNDANIDLDVPLPAKDISELFGLAKHDIQNWRSRFPDDLPIVGKRGNRNLYRPRDVLRCWSRVRAGNQ